MLVDLQKDNGELVNVIAEHPEIAARLKNAIPEKLYRVQSKYLNKKGGKVKEGKNNQTKENAKAARKAAKKEARKAAKQK